MGSEQLGATWPIGNLHVLVYEPSAYADLLRNPARTSYPPTLYDFVLRGPTRKEWDDGDISAYEPWQVELFRWRSDQDAVTVFIYESDPENGFFTSRKHDPIFLGVVHRHETVRGAYIC